MPGPPPRERDDDAIATADGAAAAASSRLARALGHARMAFFDHRPDGGGGAGDTGGEWRWSGARFGIEGVDGADGRARLIEAVSDADRPALADVLALRPSEPSRGAECRLRTPSGGTIYLCCEAYGDAGGDRSPGMVFGTVRDVTDQRRSATALNEAARRNDLLLAAIDACPVGITLADTTRPDLPLLHVNRMFSRLTGYEPEEAIGRNCRFLQGPATDRRVAAGICATIARAERAEVELMNHRKDGTPFLNRFVLVPLHDHGGRLTAYVGIHTDVTLEARRKDAEDQRQKMETLGRMMGGVAHEINNMLQPVGLLGQDLLDRALVAEAGRQHAELILECGARARAIIGDLLALARPTRPRAETLDPAALLTDSLRLLRQAIPPGVTLSVRVEPDPPRVAMDRTVFAQILLNLATNAAAAMAGRGELTILLDRHVSGSDDGSGRDHARWSRLRVIDTGHGMDRATLERAFEPFFTTKAIGQGTGLGLPVVHGLIQEMGGTITLDSAPGRGTTATILLPANDGGIGDGIDTCH
jgi:PAS domain S-box-containing protein